MISFITEEIRAQFHQLPLERQREIIRAAEDIFPQGKTVTVVFADAETLEIAIRINEEFDPLGSVDIG